MVLSTDGPKENVSVSTGENSDVNAALPVQPDSAADQNAAAETAGSYGRSSGGSADSEDLDIKGIPDQLESHRTVEVPALLGGGVVSGSEEPVIVTGQVPADADDVPADGAHVEDEADKAILATDSLHDLPDNQPVPAQIVVPENSVTELSAFMVEVKNILESLQNSLADTKYISSKIEAVSSDTDGLTKQVGGITLNCDLLTAQMESISSGANSKSALSKTFMAVSSASIVLLVVFQIYLFISLVKTRHLQNAAGTSVLDNISNLDKKMAVYDKKLTKVLENPAQQEHATPNPVAAEKTGHETPVNNEVGTAHVTTVLEKLNKMRNGLPEKKMIRKETGDWFVYDKKSNECVSDIEVIEALNQAYKKIGKTISTSIPLPAHNALCILKPDGKGGTQIVMTREFLP